MRMRNVLLLGLLLVVAVFAGLLLTPKDAAAATFDPAPMAAQEEGTLCENVSLVISPPAQGSNLFRLHITGAQHPYYVWWDWNLDTDPPQNWPCPVYVGTYWTQVLGPFTGDLHTVFEDPTQTLYMQTIGGSGGVFETSNWAQIN